MNIICGKGADNKFIPSWAYNAPDEFVVNLLKAYFDGDGNVNYDKKHAEIRASSNSKELINGICLLLSKIGISTQKGNTEKQYRLSISSKYAKIFRNLIGFDIQTKMIKLDEIIKDKEKLSKNYDIIDMIPGIGDLLSDISKQLHLASHKSGHTVFAASIRKATKKQLLGRQTLKRYIYRLEAITNERRENTFIEKIEKLKKIASTNVIWDEIVGIETIKNCTNHVYDFSVEQNENFSTFEGLFF